MLKSLFCTEKLQLHTKRNARFLKEWNHQWPRVTSQEKFINIKSKARPPWAERQPGQGCGAVLPRVVLQAGRPARGDSAASVRNAHQTVETLLLPLGPWGPDPARGLHHGFPQGLPAGGRGGRAEQGAAAAPGQPPGSPLPWAGPEQGVLLRWRPTRRPGDSGLPLLLVPLFPSGQSVQTEHFRDTARQVFKWGQNMVIYWDTSKWRLRRSGFLNILREWETFSSEVKLLAEAFEALIVPFYT